MVGKPFPTIKVKPGILTTLLQLELLILSVILCGISIFADQLGIDSGDSWGGGRKLALIVGGSLLLLSLVTAYPLGRKKNSSIFDLDFIAYYLFACQLWSLFFLLIIELSLRIIVYNPPIRVENTDIFGSLPAENTSILRGIEGYGATHFLRWGENRTPYADPLADDVVVLGDSFTQAWQLFDDQKYVSIAESVLIEDRYRVDLHNMGNSGLAMADYVSWLPVYIETFHPKTIIVQVMELDFIESFHPDRVNYFVLENDKIVDVVHKYNNPGRQVNSEYIRNNFSLMLVDWGNDRLQKFLNVGEAEKKWDIEEYDLALSRQQMDMLISVSDGIPLVFLVLPNPPMLSNEKIVMDELSHERLLELFSYYPEIILVDPFDEFQQLVSDGRLPNGFFNSATPGAGHLNRLGNNVVGRLLARAIEGIQ